MILDKIFVYGTLKRGFYYHDLVAPYVHHSRTGKIGGQLVDLGEYPGWTQGPGTVHGEVLELQPITPVLAVLDELEDYYGPADPRNLYARVTTRVVTPTDEVTAWAYRYLGPVARRRRIHNGIWLG